jgi:type III secretion protein N (ATPase)
MSVERLFGGKVDLGDRGSQRGFTPDGRVVAVRGDVIRVRVPGLGLGDRCRIDLGDGRETQAEVVGFDEDGVLAMPLGSIEGLQAQAPAVADPSSDVVAVGRPLLGRVLDAMGRSMDGRGPLNADQSKPILADPPPPLSRAPIEDPLPTGIRAIDGVLTVGRGQRVGIFAPPGTGKTTLLAGIARNISADVVVLALIGERGREVRPFIEEDLGEDGLAKSVVVVSTSEQPALLRLRAAHVATSIAEGFRDEGLHVVLLMDSVTRFARALRDVGLAAGEPPGRQGYPPTVFSELPRLFERAGRSDRGSITAFYTVLVPGDDATELSEPVADETRSLLDGHLVLDPHLAALSHYPAINVSRSVSRVFGRVVAPEHRAAAERLRRLLALYESNEHRIKAGLFNPSSDDEREMLVRRESISAFLQQDLSQPVPWADVLSGMSQAIGT